jgi:hypothetical protein
MVGTTEWIHAYEASEVEMLQQISQYGTRRGKERKGSLTSFNITISPTSYFWFRPPAAFVTTYFVKLGW